MSQNVIISFFSYQDNKFKPGILCCYWWSKECNQRMSSSQTDFPYHQKADIGDFGLLRSPKKLIIILEFG
jgi:hypothetical protein